ncbi:MAG: zf-HC2 domain-containing protein [Chitinispirillales bacterium]|jgi:anti-sigma factor RsiW|nr:zf-HC2 domain-containing protein [Chitinispirillales bacterium]
MACNKFEEQGLLYLSGELGKSDAAEYESHLSACEECRLETESYKRESALFYTADVLGETPSPAADAAILRAGENFKKARTPVFMPMMFIKKYAPVPLFLMLVMVAVGGYVRYNSMHAENLRANLTGETAEQFAITDPHHGAADMAAAGRDGLTIIDSLGIEDSNAAPRPLGNLDMEGVVTVSGGE